MKIIQKLMLVAAVIALCGSISHAQMKLNGAGATFPYAIYSKWFDLYHTKTGTEINYQSIGSGGGIKQVIEGTVDFGASDAPMTDTLMAQVKEKQGTDIIHIPTVMGAVVVTYNLPGVTGLRLDPATLAGMYLGDITSWSDPKIAACNPGKTLPGTPIIVCHRSDGSGTTNIFTEYLSKVSPDWAKKVGKGVSVDWPAGLGGKGNEGVAGLVKQSEGSVGYVELVYAAKNNLAYCALKNKAGNYVEPTFEAVSEAAAGAMSTMPSDLRVSLTDEPGKGAYPISGFTWLLISQNMKDKEKAKAIVGFLKWAMTDGQQYCKDLYYAPLPKPVVKMCEKKIAMIAVK